MYHLSTFFISFSIYLSICSPHRQPVITFCLPSGNPRTGLRRRLPTCNGRHGSHRRCNCSFLCLWEHWVPPFYRWGLVIFILSSSSSCVCLLMFRWRLSSPSSATSLLGVPGWTFLYFVFCTLSSSFFCTTIFSVNPLQRTWWSDVCFCLPPSFHFRPPFLCLFAV